MNFTYSEALLYLKVSEKQESQRNVLNANMIRAAFHGKSSEFDKFMKSITRT